MPILSNEMGRPFVEIFDSDPGEKSAVKINNRWFVLRSPISGHLPEFVRTAARLLFSKSQKTPRQSEQICLCSDSTCTRKDGTTRELLDCPRNCYGICVDATFEANDGVALSLPAIGYLTGISKQAIHKHYLAAKQELIRRVLDDPELKQCCLDLGIGSNVAQQKGER